MNFKTVMSKFARKEGEQITHTSLSGGSYHITSKSYDEFLKIYLDNMITNNKVLDLVERPFLINDTNILVIDLDLHQECNARVLTQEWIKSLCTIYIENILKYTNALDSSGLILLRERPYLYENNNVKYYKDGIHIYFPKIRLPTILLEDCRKKVIIECRNLGMFDMFLNKDDKNIIDGSLVKGNGFMMYGSDKPGLNGYQPKYEYDYYKEEKLISLDNWIRNENNVKELLNKIAPINSKNVITEVSDYGLEIMRESNTNKKKNTNNINKNSYDINLENDIINKNIDYDMIDKYLELLKDERWDDYENWIHIGMALVNIGGLSNNKCFELWKKHSKKSARYEDGCCYKYWKTFKYMPDDGYSMGSIKYWCEYDNPINFLSKSLLTHWDIMMRELGNFDNGLFRIFYLYFSEEVICTSLKSPRIYYIFNNQTCIWEEVDNTVLKSFFSEKMENILSEFKTLYNSKKDNINEDEYNKVMKIINQRLNYCRNHLNFGLIQAHINRFMINSDFNKKLNTKRDVISIREGVINLRTGNIRKREREDYFTYFLPINTTYENTDIFDKFLSDLMLDDEHLTDYVHRILGYFLSGETSEQLFFIFWGDSCNGKGVLCTLLENTLGPLFNQSTMDLIAYHNKATRSKDAANPSLMELEGKHLAIIDESDEKQKLAEGTVKYITGESLIKGRKLHSNRTSFIPYFKVCLLTNHKPDISLDEGLERRLRLVPFLAKFVNNPTEPNHRLKDPDLRNKFKNKKDLFFKWLVDGAKKYYEKRLDDIPDKMLTVKKEYYSEMDRLGAFLNEECDLSDKTGRVEINELYDRYKHFLKEEISYKKFSMEMKKKGYVSKRVKENKKFTRYFYGIKYLLDTDDL